MYIEVRKLKINSPTKTSNQQAALCHYKLSIKSSQLMLRNKEFFWSGNETSS